MRKIKKAGIYISVLLLFCIPGCGRQKQASPAVQDLSSSPVLELSAIGSSDTDSQPYWGTFVHNFARAEGGYYYMCEPSWHKMKIRARMLMFFDEETKESYPVCGKADCMHNDQYCDAFIGRDLDDEEREYYQSDAVYYHEGYVYLLGSKGNLVRFAPDGSERQVIAQVYAYDGSTGTNLVFHGDYVYVYNLMGHIGAEEEHTETITRYSLDGKSRDVIVQYTGTGAAICTAKSYGDKLFFLINHATTEKKDGSILINNQYGGLYAYEYDTGKAGKVLDAQITDYCVDEQKGIIYYHVYNDGLYQYSVGSKETVQLLQTDETCRIVSLSFDGNYIYMNNRLWVGLAKRAKQEYQKVCHVITPDGQAVNSIDCPDEVFEYFGDDKFMFSEMRGTGATYRYGYIDKSDIEHADTWTEIQP